MIYYVDGFTIDANPSPVGGGFTVTNESGEVIETQTHKKSKYTCNEGELLGLEFATMLANSGDTIITDSRIAMAWVKSGRCKARPDLTVAATRAKGMIAYKQLTIAWTPREQNKAGHVNEFAKMPPAGSHRPIIDMTLFDRLH